MAGTFVPDFEKGIKDCCSCLLFFFVLILIVAFAIHTKLSSLPLEIIPRVKLVGTFERVEYTFVDGIDNWARGSLTYDISALNSTYEFPMVKETHAPQWEIKAQWVINHQAEKPSFSAFIDGVKYSAIKFNGVTHGIRHYHNTKPNQDQPKHEWFFSEVVRDTSVTGKLVLRSEHFPKK